HLLVAGDGDGQMEDGEAVGGGLDVQAGDVDLAGAQHGGDVHKELGPVLAHHLQGGVVGGVDVLSPADLDPPALVRLAAAGGVGVGTVLPVDADAVAPGDEPHDLVS